MKPIPYNCAIKKEFYDLARSSSNMQVLFWQDIHHDRFVATLRKKGISRLIYLGFSSNMCVIGRSLGMINMVNEGFSLYFIPEASAALETQETWDSGAIHSAMTTVIAQWMAKLIHYQDLDFALI